MDPYRQPTFAVAYRPSRWTLGRALRRLRVRALVALRGKLKRDCCVSCGDKHPGCRTRRDWSQHWRDAYQCDYCESDLVHGAPTVAEVFRPHA
jgi:NAD-dependent SIR2 family protein deacetylase